jgi:hypothetical protein
MGMDAGPSFAGLCPAEGEAGADCYAMTSDARFHPHDTHWGADRTRLFFGDRHWKEPLQWDRAAKKAGVRRRNFAMSMGDLFEGRPDERTWNGSGN